MSADALAQNAIDLLEAILDEQLEFDTEPSRQLAKGLFDLATDAYENRLLSIPQALDIQSKCYVILRDGRRMDREKAEALLFRK